MTPERWQRIEELYHLVLKQDASQRAVFVKQACNGDEEMEREIESLLAHEEPANKFMESPGMAVLARAMAGDRACSMIGRRISSYQILSLLGAGGMGEVYKARDVRLGRLVALKILRQGVATDPEHKCRFLQEAKAVSALNHPHVVTLHDVGSAEGIDFLVMEYVSGETLDKLIPNSGLVLRQALQYSIEIADAFVKAHAAGIIHRDLKPNNIMVTTDGAVKVLDFGVAKLTETLEPGETNVTVPTAITTGGMILGTASYMSPEQVEGKTVDARSDIFSFGAVLYEMVTGQRAFQGDSQLSILTAILRDDPKPVGQLVDQVPGELERIIARCLRKSPEQRFQTMADVKVTIAELKEGLDSGTLAAVLKRQGLRYWRPLLTVALLAALGAVVAIWFLRSGTTASEPSLTVVPLSTYPGFQMQPSFSPDGNQVAFVWNGEKQHNWDIYVKLIGTGGPPLRLTNHPAGGHSPAWSPDGRFIAFLRWISEGKCALLLIPALGGPEREITETSCVPFPKLTWSPDGSSLVISDRDSAKELFALYLVSIESGERRKLTSPSPPWVGDISPAFAPDGRTLAFSRRVDWGYRGDLYIVPFSKTLGPIVEPKRITFDNRGAIYPAWSADGRGIVFADSRGLWRIAAPGFMGKAAEPQQLPFGESGQDSTGSHPDISRRGQRLAYKHDLIHSSIWRIATPILEGAPRVHERNNPTAVHSAHFISSTRDDSQPQFSPDGKRIAFSSNRSGNLEIWLCDADGLNPIQLTFFQGAKVTTPRWSPDSSRIAFDSDAEGQFDVWVISANGGSPQRMTTDPANDGNPSWSRDGRWIYFDSARTGEQQVWKVSAERGEPTQVTRDRGWAPLESPDGKSLYYVKDIADTDLWRISIENGQPTKVLEGLSSYLNLAIGDKGIYFVPSKNASAGSTVQFLQFATSSIRTIVSLEQPLNLAEMGGLAVSPDGRWILYTQFDQAGSELMLVENFR